MQPVWRKVRGDIFSNSTGNQETTSTEQWSDNMISTHLPIYPIHFDALNGYQISTLFESISPSVSCVLLGESTHGTREFYALRSFITKYLILYKEFTAVFIELDWPKVVRINEYVMDTLSDTYSGGINELLEDINEYPHWMGRNKIIKELIVWLKTYNLTLKQNNKASEMVSFYGVDMQCYDSLRILKGIYKRNQAILPHSHQIISFLSELKVNNFQHWTERQYTQKQLRIIAQLFESSKSNIKSKDLRYNIDQNLMTLQAAIHYFNHDCLWDIRDTHWFNTIEKYLNHFSKAKIILWAHNSHVCNAYFTNYSHSNIGAILNTKYGKNKVFTICFDTFKGTVTATHTRKELAQFFVLNENVKESFGKLFHELCEKWNENNLMIILRNGMEKMKEMRVEIKAKYFVKISDIRTRTKIRDIGVCYINSDPYSHCSNADLVNICDVLIFVNESNALEPFQSDKHTHWDKYRDLNVAQLRK